MTWMRKPTTESVKLLLKHFSYENNLDFYKENFKELIKTFGNDIIVYVDKYTFDGKNKLTSIESLARCNFPNLQTLNLSYNRLTSIEPLLECNFPNLQTLGVSFNELTQNYKQELKIKFPLLEIS